MTEVVSKTAARDLPSTRAGGQDDGSLKKLPQTTPTIKKLEYLGPGLSITSILVTDIIKQHFAEIIREYRNTEYMN